MRAIFLFIARFLKNYNLYVVKSLSFYSKKSLLDANFDFVRYGSLELCANEIKLKNVRGNLAEVGVYKGNFSEKLNKLFPERKLYLFDTFEGFDKRDILAEIMDNYSTGEQNFSNTSVELVLSKMINKENCIVKKGFFPETTAGLEDSFCFVSLDADLYQPIYEGLHFFYPKLELGGYIFIHDFNNEGYKGAREAVVKFCAELKIGYTPIPDNGGTAIISK
ncbi:MAG: methyltransferase [Chitinophagales bacterium]|nr:methyltransferase [Chitinophagales bacterium]